MPYKNKSVSCLSSRQKRRRINQENRETSSATEVNIMLVHQNLSENVTYVQDKVCPDNISCVFNNKDPSQQNIPSGSDIMNHEPFSSVDLTSACSSSSTDFSSTLGTNVLPTENVGNSSEPNILELLKAWAIDYNISHVAFSKLMQILRAAKSLDHLPKDARTFT